MSIFNKLSQWAFGPSEESKKISELNGKVILVQQDIKALKDYIRAHNIEMVIAKQLEKRESD